MKERVQKILAEAGIASRRKCEELIKQGRVKVNSQVIKLGDKADKLSDRITLNNEPIVVQSKLYFILYKPKNYLCTAKDTRGRKTVMDLIKTRERIYPAGRLDFDTEGLLIMTNDGELTNRITHPRYEIKKTYEVKLDQRLTSEQIDKLKDIIVDERKVKIENLQVKGEMVTLTIHEGRKHIVKRIFEILGRNVLSLKRIALGGLLLKDLEPGEYKHVSREFLIKKIF